MSWYQFLLLIVVYVAVDIVLEKVEVRRVRRDCKIEALKKEKNLLSHLVEIPDELSKYPTDNKIEEIRREEGPTYWQKRAKKVDEELDQFLPKRKQKTK